MTETSRAAVDPLALQTRLDAACEETGLDDFGDDRLGEALGVYLDNVRAAGIFSEEAIAQLVHLLLVNRLRHHELLRQHPEILDEDLGNPIVVIGLMRTGTTKLQRMLSADPAAHRLQFWRVLFPAPMPGWNSDGSDDLRPVMAEAYAMHLDQHAPDLKLAHTFGADQVEEDIMLQDLTFESMSLPLRTGVHDHLRWVLTEDHRRWASSYEFQLLQSLQWQDGGGRGRTWILKSPLHLGALEAMHRCYPNATFVHCHRDPLVAIGSTAALVDAMSRHFPASGQIDPHELGDVMLSLWAGEMEEHLRHRAALPQARIVDVAYNDVRDDPFSVIEAIYRAHGRSLSPDAASSIAQWCDQNPANRFGKFSYSLEHYGLKDEQVRAAFYPYIEQFGELL